MRQLSAYEQALRFLEFRPRSIAELRRKLLQTGQPSGEIEQVITRLVDQRILDDAAFARQFARTKLLGAGASRFRVKQELARKGIARAIVDQAITDLQDDEGIDSSAALDRVAEKKWKSLATLDEFTRKRRLYAFLARRGFNPDEIRSAMGNLEANGSA
jgi:regulatory protein